MKIRKYWLYATFALIFVPSSVWAAEQAIAQTSFLESLLKSIISVLSILEFKVDEMPLIVLWLILGSAFFTVRMKFINFRAFKHAIDVTRGVYDDPDEPGEVSHFQALATALAGTVGLGNIAWGCHCD